MKIKRTVIHYRILSFCNLYANARAQSVDTRFVTDCTYQSRSRLDDERGTTSKKSTHRAAREIGIPVSR